MVQYIFTLTIGDSVSTKSGDVSSYKEVVELASSFVADILHTLAWGTAENFYIFMAQTLRHSTVSLEWIDEDEIYKIDWQDTVFRDDVMRVYLLREAFDTWEIKSEYYINN